jgi:transketolase
MELLSQVHAKNLVRWAADHPEVIVLSGDLTGSTEISNFKDIYPDRFISMGMAEQNMMSFAGGLAREGYTPFVHTFAVFMYRRALDQIEMSIAYPNLRVRLFGFLPGITTPGGVSHQAINDISVLRSLPNMTVLETGDATDVETVLDTAQSVDGPVYIRMIRKDIPRLFPSDQPMELGRVRVVSRGDDVLLVTSGICTEYAMYAAAFLSEKGVSVGHMHVTTHKPFADERIVEASAKTRFGVITVENHTVVGGLGSEVAELLQMNGVGARLQRLGLQDEYAHGASLSYLLKEYRLDSLSIVNEIAAMMGENFDVPEEDLAAVSLDSSFDNTQMEAL